MTLKEKVKSMYKDGWHVIKGFKVYVENNRILRGTLGNGTDYRLAYPYKSTWQGWAMGKPTIAAFKHDNWTLK